jgi:hypothetical protein
MKFFVATVATLISFTCFSQTKTFTSDGKVTGGIGKFNYTVNNPPGGNTTTLTTEQKKEIKKEMAVKFRKALDNMQDEKYNLKKIYDNIWGTGETNKIVADYNAFLDYLTDETNTAASHDAAISNGYIIKPSAFEAKVFNVPVFSEKEDVTGKEYDMRQLIFTNPYKHFIVDYLYETMKHDGINSYPMDIKYRKAWRTLEESYALAEKALAEIREALKACAPTSCKVYDAKNKICTDYSELVKNLKNLVNNKPNDIQNLLQKSFFKKWLWYNEGFLFMNPVNATTKDRHYPESEKISQFTDATKASILSDTAEELALQNLVATKKIKNEVLIAKKSNNNKTREADRFYYDAADSYKCLNKNDLPKAKDNKCGVAIVIYNVSLKEKLSLNWEKSKDIADRGSVAQSIIDAGSGSLTDILTNSASWVTAWGKVSQSFNGTASKPFFKLMNVNYSTNVSTSTALEIQQSASKIKSYNFLQNFSYISKDLDSISTSNFAKGVTPQEWDLMVKEKENENLVVKIKDRIVVATKNSEADKIIFIKAYLVEPDNNNCNSCPKLVENCLIDTFIIRDRCYALNYESQKKLDLGTAALLNRFKCFTKDIDENRSRLSGLYDEINDNYLSQIKSYISIIQRSLPPVFTIESSSPVVYKEETLSKDTAEYRTELFEISKNDLPDKAQKSVYRVLSSLPVKKADGKTVSDPNVVIEQSYRYSNKRHWIDFSAGLAFSTKDYTVKSVDGSLPKVSEGDKFRPIAGMHIYPFGGLLKVDDRARPQLSRVSLFFGLGLTKALENFYPGISYDIVPGIRTVVGYHIYKDTRYTIVNTQVIDQASSYKGSGIFVSVSMEPKAFATFIGLIK